jgi:hypothetical protein
MADPNESTDVAKEIDDLRNLIIGAFEELSRIGKITVNPSTALDAYSEKQIGDRK